MPIGGIMQCEQCILRDVCSLFTDVKTRLVFMRLVKCPKTEQYIAEMKNIVKNEVLAIAEGLTTSRMPPTWGQEIEVEDNNIISKRFKEITKELFYGDYDGSGPWEFKIGPYQHNIIPLKFINYMMSSINFDQQDEQGNHLHLRPTQIKNVREWKNFISNLYGLVQTHFRLLANHDVFDRVCLRYRYKDWCPFSDRAYHDVVEASDESAYNFLRGFSGRYHEHITLNRNRKKTLTIEVRTAESHPLKAFTFASVAFVLTIKYGQVFKLRDYYDARYYYDYVAYDGEDLDTKISFKDMGIEAIIEPLKRYNELKKPKRVIISEINKLVSEHLNPIAKAVLTWIYDMGRDIRNNRDFRNFMSYLNQQHVPKPRKPMEAVEKATNILTSYLVNVMITSNFTQLVNVLREILQT